MPNYDITSPSIQYSNDIEYQELFRFIFYNARTQIDKTTVHDNQEDNDDELFYDEKIVNHAIDELYQLTKRNVLFQNLYKKAAAKVMSMNKTIGQCILFSYDYFREFHPCICRFLYEHYQKTQPEFIEVLCRSSSLDIKMVWDNLGEWNEKNQYYISLLEILTKKN